MSLMPFLLALCSCDNNFGTRHRILAELLEQGIRSTLTIPSHRPTAAPSATAAAVPASGAQPPRGVLEVDSMRTLGLNPSHALQHPGFYYYMAARCTEKRRERYLLSIEAEVSVYKVLMLSFQDN